MADVTSTPTGFVAVGFAYIGPDGLDVTAAVWHSDDGHTWRALARGDPSLEPARVESASRVGAGDRVAVRGSRVMTTVTSTGSLLVAMGLEVAPGSTESTPLLWVSKNGGVDWQVSAIVEPRLDGVGHLVAFRNRLVVPAHGEGQSRSQLWVARPDTTSAQSAAIDSLTLFAQPQPTAGYSQLSSTDSSSA